MTEAVPTEPVTNVHVNLVAGLELYGAEEAQALCWVLVVVIALGISDVIAGVVIALFGGAS